MVFEKDCNRVFRLMFKMTDPGLKKLRRVTQCLLKLPLILPSYVNCANIARDWAGIQSTGFRHLDYYEVKRSYHKDAK